jgi:serine/threonine-protein kinase
MTRDMSEEISAVEPPDPLVGSVLADRYRIERRLGEGGMGVVYLARHVILEKIVALKILHHEYARRRELVDRFLHEAKAASRIRHEHVIDITDFGETPDKNVFFAMEFLDGHELADELERGGPGIPWPRTKSIILQICSALQAAHEAGVIHRDLKPENVYLINRYGNPDFIKVLDFGVAKLVDGEADGRRLTKTGMVFGTPEYMSPEQAKGEKPDPRVDVYACGCILYEMVTGDVPFRADSFMGVLTKHLLDQPPRLAERTTREDLPSGLQSVLDQALSKDRDQRFGTMNELAVAIDTLDEVAGVSYRAPGPEKERARSRGGLGSRGSASRIPSPPPPELAATVPPPATPAATTMVSTPPPPVMAAPAAPPKRRPTTPPPSDLDATVPTPLDEPFHLPRRRVSPATIAAAAAALVVGFGAVAIMSSGSKPAAPPEASKPSEPIKAAPPPVAAAPPPEPTKPEPAAATPPTPPAEPPKPEPAAATAAVPEPPKPEPATVTAPAPEPAKPEPAAATTAAAPEPVKPTPAAVTTPPPEPSKPEPAPVAPPPKPATATVVAPAPAPVRPSRSSSDSRKRAHEHHPEKKPTRPVPAMAAPPPPTPAPAPAPAPAPEKKSDLKDPFKKK